MQIAGAGTANTQVIDDLSEAVIGHILACQDAIPQMRETLFIVNCEANMAYAASSIEAYLARHVDGRFRYYVLRDDRRARGSTAARNSFRAIVVTAGTRTTNENKVEMVHATTTLLNQDRLHFHRRFVSTFASEPLAGDSDDLREVIARQMRGFRRRYLPPKRGDAMLRYAQIRYEGVEEDDFVMATMLTHYTMRRCDEIPEVRADLRSLGCG